ncbi:MAG: reverse transcriptase-like protein [Caldilineaceae bacterium]
MHRQIESGPRLWVFCDGGAGGAQKAADPATRAAWRKYFRTEPICTAAAVARNQRGQIIDWRWQRLAQGSNNEAEYAGLLLGLELGLAHQAAELMCVMDSEVVVGQMRGYFNVNSAELRPWHWRACALVRRLPQVRFYLAPREWNCLADGLASQAMMPWRELALAIEAFNTEVFT